MIGRSYNGTLPNAVAATGVEGLTTIVPIAAISSWYDYSRMGGIIGSTPHYPALLSNYVTDEPRRAICAPVRDAMSLLDGDADGTMNPFWDERNYRPDANKVKASVFATHCLQDDNVDPDQIDRVVARARAQQRPAQAVAVPRGAHRPVHDQPRRVDAPAARRGSTTGCSACQNGIMSEPRVDIENTKDNWATYADWPLPGAHERRRVPAGRHGVHGRAARRRLRRRDRHAGLDRPAQPERGDGAEHRGEHDAEQPPRVPLARAEGRPAALRLAAVATCARRWTSRSRTSRRCSSTTARAPRSRAPATASRRPPTRPATAGARRRPASAPTAR